MNRFVIGDIHGGLLAFKQVIELSKFDYEKDLLIFLGDVVDGWSQSKECIEELLKIKNLVSIMGNHDCFHKDTEFLTIEGWKKYHEIIETDLIAEFDIDSKKIFYNKYISRIEKYSDKLISIEGHNSKQIVTSNHDIIVDNKKIKATEILNKEIRENQLILNSIYEGNQEYNIDDDTLKLLMWVLMDGCIVKDSTRKYGVKRIQFKLSKERKIKKLCDLLNNLEIKYTINETKKGGINKLTPFIISFYGEYKDIVSKYLFINNEKTMPEWFKTISKRQTEIILNIASETDGSLLARGMSFGTSRIRWANIIQELCIRNGFICRIDESLKNNGFGNKMYSVHISNFIGTPNYYKLKINEIDYNDNVVCFQMPKGTLITRIHGKVSFTGNCWFQDFYTKKMNPHFLDDNWNSWQAHGGRATLFSFGATDHQVNYDPFEFQRNFTIEPHIKMYFDECVPYYILDDMFFTHGGFEPHNALDNHDPSDFAWNRSLIRKAYESQHVPQLVKQYKEVYLGHTPTISYNGNFKTPQNWSNIWAMDTGACFTGKLSMMNIDTKEIFQSVEVRTLYPSERGRNRNSWDSFQK